MLRIAETFEAVVVPDRMREMLSSGPLRVYEANCWTGALDRGEKRAAILQTHATDIFAECLSFTVTHLVFRVADSGLRDFAMLADPAWDRKTSRLAAEFAHRLTEALARAMRDSEGERPLDSFRKIAQIMYPSIAEIRTTLVNYRHQDRTMIWLRAIDHALYLPTMPPGATDRPVLDSLATLFDGALYAFYPFFLATAYGDRMYAQFEDVHRDDRLH